jgi:hypothetical protein
VAFQVQWVRAHLETFITSRSQICADLRAYIDNKVRWGVAYAKEGWPELDFKEYEEQVSSLLRTVEGLEHAETNRPMLLSAVDSVLACVDLLVADIQRSIESYERSIGAVK